MYYLLRFRTHHIKESAGHFELDRLRKGSNTPFLCVLLDT